jgi:pullulanase/glycogen debranching enzyme
MKLNKLGALFLLTSQGITMISEGQEFARTKVIPMNPNSKDPDKGKIDHNSYNKDNETNYINYNHANKNKELVDYYKGLIELRKSYAAFRHADYNDIVFYSIPKNKFGLSYSVKHLDEDFIVLFNADQKEELEFNLPEGKWEVMVDKNSSGTKPLFEIEGKIKLEPVSGAVLKSAHR